MAQHGHRTIPWMSLEQGTLPGVPCCIPPHLFQGRKKKSIPPVHAGFAKMVKLLHRRTAELGFSLGNNNNVGVFCFVCLVFLVSGFL